MKNVVILGSTGKIGTQALEVIREHKGRFNVVGLVAGSNITLLKKQIEEHKPRIVVVADSKKAEELNESIELEVRSGASSINDAIQDADIVINAMVGRPGLAPSLEALRKGKVLGLAHKETMVLAGNLAMELSSKYGGQIIPIDSEHSAIFQSLKSGKVAEVKRLVLTMGTGPIAEMDKKMLHTVTMEQVMERRAWDMGTKISIDSATCINKAFEIIEAGHLFGVSASRIDVIVHPEYAFHSLVEFRDGSIITEMGTPDMRRYVQYALFYPERPPATVSGFLDLLAKPLTFKKPPYDTFPCLKLGFRALEERGTMPAVLHGADTIAAEAFREGKIMFTDIPLIIERTMNAHDPVSDPDLAQILEAESWAEVYAKELVGDMQ